LAKKILLIKLRHHGDVLLITPLIEGLKFFDPEAVIDCLIYQESLPLLQHHRDVHQVLTVDRGWRKKSFFHRFKQELNLIRAIKNARYDMVFNLTEGDRGALYALLSCAKRRIGEDPCGTGFFGKRYCYTEMVSFQGVVKHQVEMHLDFLRKINLHPPSHVRKLSLYLTAADEKAAAQVITDKTVLIHPVSRWMFKAVPASTMSQVANQLIRQGYQVVLTGSLDSAEVDYNREVYQSCPPQRCINMTGQWSLGELSAGIKRAPFFIGVDSLPMHIAAVFKTPTVAIFGPTSSKRWGPWENPHAILVEKGLSCQPCYRKGCQNAGVSDCLETLGAEAILAAFFRLEAKALA
jgi:heptosyltransferase-3